MTANGAAGESHSAACVEEAEDTVKELRAALERAGISLPSLRVDPATFARLPAEGAHP
ncbi:hypothetical protein GCM10010245_77090 [Streptomyces spectabilis]|nr:hypothetical protein GCM10010245_77090 [Streptomyces spectabilis]